MFLHLSASHSVHGGGGDVHLLDRHPSADTPRQSPPTPQGRHLSPAPEMATKRAVRILLECIFFI